MKKIIRAIYLVLAFLFLGIGIAGIVLPILPTTPFLLLTAALFAKSSERFHKWFVSTKLYDKYIDQALNRKAMTKETKRKAMATLGIIFLAGFLFSPVWYAKAIIVVIAFLSVFLMNGVICIISWLRSRQWKSLRKKARTRDLFQKNKLQNT